jgi:hypothetical protein
VQIKIAVEKQKIGIYKTEILPVVLHGHETWSLTLREEQGAEDKWRAYVNVVIKNAGRFSCGCTTSNFSRSAQLHS